MTLKTALFSLLLLVGCAAPHTGCLIPVIIPDNTAVIIDGDVVGFTIHLDEIRCDNGDTVCTYLVDTHNGEKLIDDTRMKVDGKLQL